MGLVVVLLLGVAPVHGSEVPDATHNLVVFQSGPTGDIPDGRIFPVTDGQEFCDDVVLGLWGRFVDRQTEALDEIEAAFTFDGRPIDAERTPNKKIGWAPHADLWFFSEGDPDLGLPGVGTHSFSSSFIDPRVDVAQAEAIVMAWGPSASYHELADGRIEVTFESTIEVVPAAPDRSNCDRG